MSSPVKTTHVQTTVTKTLTHSAGSGEPHEHTTVTKTSTHSTEPQSEPHEVKTVTKTLVHKSVTGEKTELDLKDGSVALPHARKSPGVITTSEFLQASSVYVLEYSTENEESTEATEIFVPHLNYPGGYRVTATDGHCSIEKHDGYDVIKHEHDSNAKKHRVVVERKRETMTTTASSPSSSGYTWYTWSGRSHSNWPVYAALAVAVFTPYLTL